MKSDTTSSPPEKLDIRLRPWRPLRVGLRVKVATICKYRTGYLGYVKERLDTRLDGLGHYGVSMDCDGGSATTDFLRYELTPVREKGRLVYVLPRRRLRGISRL